MARDGAVEGVAGAVADLARDLLDGLRLVLEPMGGKVHSPARQVGERGLANGLREASRQSRA